MKKIWDTVRKKWLILNELHRYKMVDEDGYCTCSMCQEQKSKENMLPPDELFEL